MQVVGEAALSTNLFKPETVKVRIQTFEHFLNGGTDGDFIHVFAHIIHSEVLRLLPPVVVIPVLCLPAFKCDKKLLVFFMKQNS